MVSAFANYSMAFRRIVNKFFAHQERQILRKTGPRQHDSRFIFRTPLAIWKLFTWERFHRTHPGLDCVFFLRPIPRT